MPMPLLPRPSAAGPDPFAYTGGSLLTPWTEAFRPHGEGQQTYPGFWYNPVSIAGAQPQTITPERIGAPERFTYGDFAMPTEQTMQRDPGYGFRLGEGRRQLEAAQAAKGLLRTGGSLKDILSFGQDLASQEYGAAYNRARDVYGLNRANAADIRDFNWQSQFEREAANQAAALRAAEANAANQLQFGQLGLAAHDRNYQIARQQWEDMRDWEQQQYGRSLGEYGLRRDVFEGNQANQFNRLMSMANLGHPGQYAAGMSDLLTGVGNVQAAGRVGSANSWGSALSHLGDLGMMGTMYPTLWGTGAPRRPSPTRRNPIEEYGIY